MKRIAHISDLHFGRIETGIEEGLLRDLDGCRADLVVVSGDLTQRARENQFVRARAFLDRIAAPTLVVPGNHDIPLYNAARRLLNPLGRYRRHISDDLSPVYRDDEIAVFGVNTTRRFPVIMGRVSISRIAEVCREVKVLSGHAFRIVVAHHPFLAPAHGAPFRLVGRAKRALAAFAACGVELVLAGHYHMAYAGISFSEDAAFHGRILVIQGATVSSRTRGEPNSYHIIDLDRPDLSLSHRVWDGERFIRGLRENWRREGKWVKI
jgi:3',5'-cyclic AMP phosphodiesterase CpdA